MARTYLTRLIDKSLDTALLAHPAIQLTGPRAAGKTTTARRRAATVIQLDRPVEARAFVADPDTALRGLPEPVLLDEWQVVPDVLGAVKRAVDFDPHPGRFIITGSVRAELDMPTWPGTGRVIRFDMFGLIRKEINRSIEKLGFIEQLTTDTALTSPHDPPDLRDYAAMIVESGFPYPVLSLNQTERQQWLTTYIDQVIERDIPEVEGAKDPERLRRFFEAFSANTSGVIENLRLAEAAKVTQKTAASYERLLERLFLVELLPAWSSNRLKRLTRQPKRHVVDPSLAAAALSVDADGMILKGDLLGRFIESFVVSQLRAEIAFISQRARLYHLRTEHGRQEIDLIIELANQKVIAIEIKISAAPANSAAKHLCWLRDRLGDDFVAGIVLHTGPRVFQMDEKVTAAPIACLWS